MSISILYPLLFISLSMVSEFRLKRMTWLSDQLGEYLDILVTFLLLFDFRLHDCKDYHFILLDKQHEEVDATVLVAPGRQTMFIAEQYGEEEPCGCEDTLSLCSCRSAGDGTVSVASNDGSVDQPASAAD